MLSTCPEDLDAGLVIALQQPVQLAGDDTPQAPFGVTAALTFGGAAGDVGAGVGVDPQAHQQDGVQRAVELPVATAVEPVAGHLPRGRGDRVGPGRRSKGGLDEVNKK